MDPLNIVNSFATIVSLISIFRQENQDSGKINEQDFLDWLTIKKLDAVRDRLGDNQAVLSDIQLMLQIDYESLSSKLDSIDRMLAGLAGRIDTRLALLAEHMYPNVRISDQAYSILKQFSESGGSKFAIIKNMRSSAPDLVLIGNAKGNGKIMYSDERFLEDDLRVLCELGLLFHELSPNARQSNYKITREAVEFIRVSES